MEEGGIVGHEPPVKTGRTPDASPTGMGVGCLRPDVPRAGSGTGSMSFGEGQPAQQWG